ncbi:hypothetical protein D3C83_305840 [compost metagenome]
MSVSVSDCTPGSSWPEAWPITSCMSVSSLSESAAYFFMRASDSGVAANSSRMPVAFFTSS